MAESARSRASPGNRLLRVGKRPLPLRGLMVGMRSEADNQAWRVCYRTSMKNLLLACCVPMFGGCTAAIPALHSAAVAVAAHASAAPVAVAAGAAGAGLGIGVIAGDDIRRLAQEAMDTRFGTQLAGTFGAFLQDSQTEAHGLVQAAMQAQREVPVVAGLQVQSAIATAQAAYRDKLNLKIERLGDQEKKFKADMESVIADLKSATDSTQKEAGDRAKLVAANLRLTTDVPQLRSFGPVFLFPFLPRQWITLRGSFPDSYARSSVPELSIDGKSYKALAYQADTLQFSVPTAAFEVAEPQAIVWKRAELIVPWDKPVWNITTSGELAKFGVEMGLLPHSFGRMTMEHTIANLRQEEKARVSDDYLFDAGDHDVEENRCLTLTPQELSDGWRIRRGTGAFVLSTRFAGTQNADWKDLGLQSESDRSVCWRALTVHAGATESGNPSSNIIWRISAKIWREVSDPGAASESVDLAWGSQHYFKYAAGTWKLRYSRIGGSVKEVESSDLSNPLIKVNSDASSVMISIYPF